MFLAKSGKTFSLIHLYTEFVRQITLFGPVRRALRDIDNHSWVVDPPPPGMVTSLFYFIVTARLLLKVGLFEASLLKIC